MSDTAILTLRTMLANLDDAKKYQSLRDVMSTPARARPGRRVRGPPAREAPRAVPPVSQGPGGGDFAELTPETQQDLIDGLTDKGAEGRCGRPVRR